MFLGLCLEQWYWLFSIIGSIALLLTLGGVIYYARQAKISAAGAIGQVEKTHLLFEETKKQTDASHVLAKHAKEQVQAARDLVIQGQREFEPNVVVRVLNPEVEWGNEKINILFWLGHDPFIIIPFKIINLSKSISKFNLTFFPWLFDLGNNEEIDLKNLVMGALYKGEHEHILVFNEEFEGGLGIDFMPLLREGIPEGIKEDVRDFRYIEYAESKLQTLLKNREFRIEIYVNYTNETVKGPRFYDYYKATIGELRNTDNGKGFVGTWYFWGRKEEYWHPK